MQYRAAAPRDAACQGRQRPRAGLRLLAGLGAALLAAGLALAQPAAGPTTVEVGPGDSFSTLAARFTGAPWRWQQLYHPQLSGIADPGQVGVGMRFELVTEPSGRRYLRLIAAAPAPAASAPRAAATPMAASSAARTPAASASTAAVVAAAPVKASAAVAVPAAMPSAAVPSAAVPSAVVASAAPAAARGSGAAETLVVGVLPNIGAGVLLAQYENLRSWFERRPSLALRIVVPRSFKAFFDSMMRGDYDIAVAAPHFARIAQLDRGMVPLVHYEPRIAAVLVSAQDGGINTPAQAHGKSLGFANPSSLVALYGLQWLHQQGLDVDRDFQLRAARTDLGVGRLLLTGEVAAAVMSDGEFRALPQDETARMKIIETFASIPNFVVLAHPRLGEARIAQLRDQFKRFIADPEEGAAFRLATGVRGLDDANEALLRELDPYVDATRRTMGYSR
jgi:phosphonate transport system substrate-binding protein